MTTTHLPRSSAHGDLAAVAEQCLKAWSSGDAEATRELLSDDVVFDGPLGHVEGRDAYVSGVASMAESIRGVDLKRLMVDGDDVCLIYDLVSEQAGAVPTVGWYHFSGNKIDSVRAYFDPRPLVDRSAKRCTLDMPFFAAGLQLCHEGEDFEDYEV